jgi:hypothetical protein
MMLLATSVKRLTRLKGEKERQKRKEKKNQKGTHG